MVEGARLESVYTGNCIEGSNPSVSAVCILSIFCKVAETNHFILDSVIDLDRHKQTCWLSKGFPFFIFFSCFCDFAKDFLQTNGLR